MDTPKTETSEKITYESVANDINSYLGNKVELFYYFKFEVFVVLCNRSFDRRAIVVD